MANTAPSSGTAAARSPRNTKKSNRIKNGSAKSSARPRSWEDTAAIWTSATVGPPSQVLPLSEGCAAMACWRAVNSLLLLDGADSGDDNGEVPVFGDHGRATAGVGVVEDPLDLRARPQEGNDRRHPARHGRRDPDGCRSADDYFVALFGIGARDPLDLMLRQYDGRTGGVIVTER